MDGVHSVFSYLEVLHKDGDDDIDEHKLRHEHEDNKEDRSDERADAAVADTVVARIAVLSQRVLPTDTQHAQPAAQLAIGSSKR